MSNFPSREEFLEWLDLGCYKYIEENPECNCPMAQFLQLKLGKPELINSGITCGAWAYYDHSVRKSFELAGWAIAAVREYDKGFCDRPEFVSELRKVVEDYKE